MCNGVAVSAVKEVPSMRSGKTGCCADLPDVQLFKERWFPEDSDPETSFKRVFDTLTDIENAHCQERSSILLRFGTKK
jgi:hypothetical protein